MRVAIGLVSIAAALLLAGSSGATAGIWLSEPANDAVVPPGQTVGFAFGTDWLTGVFPGALNLQVAKDAGFEDTVVDQTLSCPASFELSCPSSSVQGPFGPGTYFWHIRWLSQPEAGPVEWVPSETRTFHVGEASPAGNVPPTAAFAFEPAHPRPGDLVRFDGSGSRDADGSVISYSWSFGNGNGAAGTSSVGATYDTSGTYTVTLVVADDRGATGLTTATVVVGEQPPSGTTATVTTTTMPTPAETTVAPADTTPPTVTAFPVDGRHGASLRIRFRVHDDSGQSAVETTFRSGGKVLASMRVAHVQNGLRTVLWRAPRAAGRVVFCVRARDAASNVSAASCAMLRIR
jgi:hypothetical protein